MNSGRSLVLTEQSMGPRTEPRGGALYLRDCTSDVEALTCKSEIYES